MDVSLHCVLQAARVPAGPLPPPLHAQVHAVGSAGVHHTTGWVRTHAWACLHARCREQVATCLSQRLHTTTNQPTSSPAAVQGRCRLMLPCIVSWKPQARLSAWPSTQTRCGDWAGGGLVVAGWGCCVRMQQPMCTACHTPTNSPTSQTPPTGRAQPGAAHALHRATHGVRSGLYDTRSRGAVC